MEVVPEPSIQCRRAAVGRISCAGGSYGCPEDTRSVIVQNTNSCRRLEGTYASPAKMRMMRIIHTPAKTQRPQWYHAE